MQNRISNQHCSKEGAAHPRAAALFQAGRTGSKDSETSYSKNLAPPRRALSPAINCAFASLPPQQQALPQALPVLWPAASPALMIQPRDQLVQPGPDADSSSLGHCASTQAQPSRTSQAGCSHNAPVAQPSCKPLSKPAEAMLKLHTQCRQCSLRQRHAYPRRKPRRAANTRQQQRQRPGLAQPAPLTSPDPRHDHHHQLTSSQRVQPRQWWAGRS
jgi:hypothetical protein